MSIMVSMCENSSFVVMLPWRD